MSRSDYGSVLSFFTLSNLCGSRLVYSRVFEICLGHKDTWVRNFSSETVWECGCEKRFGAKEVKDGGNHLHQWLLSGSSLSMSSLPRSSPPILPFFTFVSVSVIFSLTSFLIHWLTMMNFPQLHRTWWKKCLLSKVFKVDTFLKTLVFNHSMILGRSWAIVFCPMYEPMMFKSKCYLLTSWN